MDDALRLRLRDVDVFAAMALELGRRSKAMGEKAETWVGRCVDVSKAYKQLGISADHQDLAVIAPESGGDEVLLQSKHFVIRHFLSRPSLSTGSQYYLVSHQ